MTAVLEEAMGLEDRSTNGSQLPEPDARDANCKVMSITSNDGELNHTCTYQSQCTSDVNRPLQVTERLSIGQMTPSSH
jgi:hypothetical protein